MSSLIKGPALFLAQFVSDEAPFNTLATIVEWAADLGYKGVQIPTWDTRLFNLDAAASSQSYCIEHQLSQGRLYTVVDLSHFRSASLSRLSCF